MKRILASLIVLSAMFTVLHLSAFAGPVTVPTGLNPGDQYRLAFVTSTDTAATSTNIADYNTFVTNVAQSVPALATLGTTWTAIASTATVNADDNTFTNPSSDASYPIYDLGGTLVAASYAELWSGNILSPIDHTETGDSHNELVWTGSIPNGTADVLGRTLGSTTGENGYIVIGIADNTSPAWISASGGPPADLNSLYALSGVLMVPSPEPTTFVLLGSAFLMIGGTRFLRWRRANPLPIRLAVIAPLALWRG